MVSPWTSWKSFPNPKHGGSIEAPIGPGVYEVRRTSSGELVAFESAANVAQALVGLRLHTGVNSWLTLLRGAEPAESFEYRTRATATRADAKAVADTLRGRRHVYWRRRAGWRLAGGSAA
jgi:hypothetical protein